MDTESHRRALASVSYTGAWENTGAIPKTLRRTASTAPLTGSLAGFLEDAPVKGSLTGSLEPADDGDGGGAGEVLSDGTSATDGKSRKGHVTNEGQSELNKRVGVELVAAAEELDLDAGGTAADKKDVLSKKKSPSQFLQEKASVLLKKAKTFQKKDDQPIASRTRLGRQQAPVSHRLRGDRSEDLKMKRGTKTKK